MRRARVIATLFTVCLILALGRVLADASGPIGAPARDSDGSSTGPVAEMEGGPTRVDDLLLSGICGEPEGGPCSGSEETLESFTSAPYGEPVADH
jgi:hypothetical protein